MTIKDLIKSGELADARAQLIEKVKTSPADSAARTLLFQVLILLGEFDKADRHLDTLAVQDKTANPAYFEYKNLLLAEKERLKVIKHDALPSFLPKTPVYFDIYYQAIKKLKEENLSEAVDLFQQVESHISPISGTINGKPFDGIKNTDTTLAYFLETITHDRYVWIPFEEIREVIITPPKTLFDLIWIPASITTWEGLTMNCVLPVIYPNSSSHENDLIKMGKMTEWNSLGGHFVQGLGQQVFEIDGEDMALLEIEQIVFNLVESE